MKIKSLPEAERPLEKALESGIGSLSNMELLALIIRTGTRESSALSLAGDILASCRDGLCDLGRADFEELVSIKGMGPGKSGAVLAAIELGKRISASRKPERKSLTSAEDVAELFMERLRYRQKESFFALILNVKGELLDTEEISVGELTGTIVHPREVFRSAIRKSACAVIFVHNHPSGDPSPSAEDIGTTERLVRAGEILGVKVMDHIIIGDGTYSSMKNLGFVS